MQTSLETVSSELEKLSDYLQNSNDTNLADLNEKIIDSLTGVFFLIAQLNPNYRIKFTEADRKSKLAELSDEITSICNECLELSQSNEILAAIIGGIQKNKPSQETINQAPSQRGGCK